MILDFIVMGTGSMQHSRGDGKASNKSKSVFWCGVATKKKVLNICEVFFGVATKKKG